MKYSEKEKELIRDAFRITRLEFEQDLDFNREIDVVKALIMYRDKYHMNDENREITKKIFRKMGLWEDGTTTLEERNKQIFKQKTEYARKYRQLLESRDETLKEVSQEVEKLRVKLLKPQDEILLILDNDLDKMKDKVKSESEQRLRNEQQKLSSWIADLRNEINTELDKMRDSLRSEVERVVKLRLDQIVVQLEDEYDLAMKKLDVIMGSKTRQVEIDYLQEEIEKIEAEIKENAGIKPLKAITKDIAELQPEARVPEPEKFECPFCEKELANKGGLGSHIYHIHGTDKFNEYKQAEENKEVKEEG